MNNEPDGGGRNQGVASALKCGLTGLVALPLLYVLTAPPIFYSDALRNSGVAPRWLLRYMDPYRLLSGGYPSPDNLFHRYEEW